MIYVPLACNNLRRIISPGIGLNGSNAIQKGCDRSEVGILLWALIWTFEKDG
jgi:hypothetical protein